MTGNVLVATKVYSDGADHVLIFDPALQPGGAQPMPTRVETVEVRWEFSEPANAPSEGYWYTSSRAAFLRVEVPGQGADAPDFDLFSLVKGVYFRNNGQLTFTIALGMAVPTDHPYTQFSLRVPIVPQMLGKPIGGRLVVG